MLSSTLYCDELVCTQVAEAECATCKEHFCARCNVTHDCATFFLRIPLSQLATESHKFKEAMEKQGFAVLTTDKDDLWWYQNARDQLMRFYSLDRAAKQAFSSSHVYWNERGVPMWYCGYEGCDMRDAFRVPNEKAALMLWPSEAFEKAFVCMTSHLQAISDLCLEILVGQSVVRPEATSGQDKSVCYAVHYPNNRGGQQEEGINISEHVDPSLVVLEPCTEVEGLEIYDYHNQRWFTMEKYCKPGEGIIVFAGDALQNATNGRVRGTLHRVSQDKSQSRDVVVYEQKYTSYYPQARRFD